MKFRTEIENILLRTHIGYGNHILSLGSCFADEMARRLTAAKFHITANPTGVLFNPHTVADALRSFERGQMLTTASLHEEQGVWFDYNFHGSFSAESPAAALKKMNAAIATGHQALAEADRVLLTFGTAWVYELVATGTVVANCHRQPQSLFTRRRLTVEQIVAEWSALFSTLLADKEIILTVSPVRHLGDSLIGNTLSKATLLLAAEALTKAYPNVSYFPAYELLTDDLRDYRFYADDLVHPAPQAVDYIWEKFCTSALSDHTRHLLTQVEALVTATHHRPTHPNSTAYRLFCQKMSNSIVSLEQATEGDFSEEKEHFTAVLSK
ncbi:MAG: GSCFA domain-containing protein [Alistipes sp.]